MVKKRGKYVNCDYCGKIVWKENNQLKNKKNLFCSYQCWANFQKHPMEYTIIDNYAIFYIKDKSLNEHCCYVDIEDTHFLDHQFFITYGKDNKPFSLQDFHGRKLHRLIMNPPKNMVVDHINHNIFDNRKSNLRICSKGENNQNKKGYSITSTTQIRNVYFKKQENKYFVKITVKGKGHFRGYFPNTAEGLNEAIKTARELRKEIMPFST